MSNRLKRVALIDSGFWYAFFDERDEHHNKARALGDSVDRLKSILLPWPILYETLCTRFVRRPTVIRAFEAILKRPNAVKVEDGEYRIAALEAVLTQAHRGLGELSLVDQVLRMVIEDAKVPVGSLYTFNVRDFAGVCRKQGVELMCQTETSGFRGKP